MVSDLDLLLPESKNLYYGTVGHAYDKYVELDHVINSLNGTYPTDTNQIYVGVVSGREATNYVAKNVSTILSSNSSSNLSNINLSYAGAMANTSANISIEVKDVYLFTNVSGTVESPTINRPPNATGEVNIGLN